MSPGSPLAGRDFARRYAEPWNQGVSAMNRYIRIAALVFGVVAFGSATRADAQVVTVWRPVTTPVTTFYAPAATPVVVNMPVVAPVAGPVVYSAASPVLVETPAPVLAPAAVPVAQPVPVVTYFRAPAVGFAPVPQVVTRHRPILGGTVSRVRYSYMPVVF
jgi:hypothetical protein